MSLLTTDLKIFKQKILQKVNKAYLGRKIIMESADLGIASSLRSRNNVHNITSKFGGKNRLMNCSVLEEELDLTPMITKIRTTTNK